MICRSTNSRHAPGEIYFIVASGFHGVFPGCFLFRCKIGLASDAQKRLERLESIQAPCNYRLIKVIKVRDMAAVESQLHKQFSTNNVALKRSREWFDLNILQLWCACQAFQRYENHPRYGINRVYRFPLKLIARAIASLLVVIAASQQMINHQYVPPSAKVKRVKL